VIGCPHRCPGPDSDAVRTPGTAAIIDLFSIQSIRYQIDMIGTGTALSRHTKRMEVAMSRVHPLKRIQVAAAAFAVMGLALAATAEPLNMVDPSGDVIILPLAESAGADTSTSTATPRRAWRDQLPAMIVLRRARPS